MVLVSLALATVALIAASPDEKRISVYSVAANYSLPVSEHSGRDYVGLLETLEPLGSVSAKVSGDHWKLSYNEVQCEFVGNKKRFRLRGKEFDLPANFVIENGRGLVPLSSLSTLLPRILGGPVTFNEVARRLFIGNVTVHFTAQVTGTNPPALIMNFTSPVNPSIATEPGKLRMTFTREAVVAPGSQFLTFNSSVIPSASFQEKNGEAEIVVNSAVPLMANFSNGGRTIIIAPPLAPAGAAASKEPSPPPKAAPPISPATAPPAAATPSSTHYFAVIDAGHGGDERGAALTDQLAEKDITLAMARSLRQELAARGLTTLMVRDADITLTADQRAGIANATKASIYLCVHASSEGRGVRLYTALLPPPSEGRGLFFDWNTVQAPFLQASQTAEAGIAVALKAKEIPVRTLTASLRPLNNLAFPAVAIEVASQNGDITQLSSPSYQSLIAAAVASGLADNRDRWKVQQ